MNLNYGHSTQGGKWKEEIQKCAWENFNSHWKTVVCMNKYCMCQSQWPRGLRRRSTAACPLRSWVRIPPGTWISVCCECCVLSGRGLCDGLITRPEEFYRVWCIAVLETSLRGVSQTRPVQLAQAVLNNLCITKNKTLQSEQHNVNNSSLTLQPNLLLFIPTQLWLLVK